eukprot:NODE_28_length_38599_cov_0.791792.p13 type:complete len:164 gc:universal NODE_28_length_38599_cov_0.791792:1820-2311(+)
MDESMIDMIKIYNVKFNGIANTRVIFELEGDESSKFVWDSKSLGLFENKQRIKKARADEKKTKLKLYDASEVIGEIYQKRSLINCRFLADLSSCKIYVHRNSDGMRFYLGKKNENGVRIAKYEIEGWFQPRRLLKIEPNTDPSLIMLIFMGVEYLLGQKYAIV